MTDFGLTCKKVGKTATSDRSKSAITYQEPFDLFLILDTIMNTLEFSK